MPDNALMVTEFEEVLLGTKTSTIFSRLESIKLSKSAEEMSKLIHPEKSSDNMSIPAAGLYICQRKCSLNVNILAEFARVWVSGFLSAFILSSVGLSASITSRFMPWILECAS